MTEPTPTENLAVLTSGGDSQGMNAAVRAVVRTALHHELGIHLVYEGYDGLVGGGDLIRPATSEDVGGILHQGGTIIGSARSPDFLTEDGRRRAAANLAGRGIDALVVIGGDGSLTGADVFRREWPEHLSSLIESGELDPEQAEQVPQLQVVGLVGSIDNDMFGTDMTIGADTALHRITEAIDAILSTAASHQRTFVVEVMGRNCGYLALMGALATGANWVLIPESPPDTDDWEASMCATLRAGREAGRRQNTVVVAEGATDREGRPITSQYVKEVLESRLGEDTRVTILGHVQRGGSPSAFDRHLGTVLGHAAVERIMEMSPEDDPVLLGFREHRIVASPLMDMVQRTHEVAERIQAHDYDAALRLRGGSFKASFGTFRTLVKIRHERPRGRRDYRFGVMHGGGPAPGMNTAVRAAVRLGIDQGHQMVAIHRGIEGLLEGELTRFDWMDVSAWVGRGGAELGTSRVEPDPDEARRAAEVLRDREIDGLLMIGGWAGYRTAHALHAGPGREVLEIPVVCLPASINNDLPGSELSVGSDTALNSIVTDVDKIKQSAVASRRCFVVEVMGGDSGYLAMLGGLATGAEHVYLPEDGITLDQLVEDLRGLAAGFRQGKRLGLVIRNEHADDIYTTAFIRDLFDKEGGDLFDVRQAVLGHVQQGGAPSPFDRIQATRLADRCIDFLIDDADAGRNHGAMIGLVGGELTFTDLDRFPQLIADDAQRPREQSWLRLRPMASVMMSRPGVVPETG